MSHPLRRLAGRRAVAPGRAFVRHLASSRAFERRFRPPAASGCVLVLAVTLACTGGCSSPSSPRLPPDPLPPREPPGALDEERPAGSFVPAEPLEEEGLEAEWRLEGGATPQEARRDAPGRDDAERLPAPALGTAERSVDDRLDPDILSPREAEVLDRPEPEPEPPRRDWKAVAAEYVRRLRLPPPESSKAFRELLEVPKPVIPHLIPLVDDDRSTHFDQLDVWIEQKDIARFDEAEQRYYYFVRGMGRFAFDDIAVGRHRVRGRGYRVRYRNYGEEFSLGVVLRAALLNRFYPTPPPKFSDRDIVRWWRAYHDLARDRL